jgi:hypothetical protein
MATILGQPKLALQMARAGLAQGRPDATERLKALVQALVKKG